MKRKIITISLDSEFYRRVRHYCVDNGFAFSKIVNIALKKYLKEAD
jgi:hypothetical protein